MINSPALSDVKCARRAGSCGGYARAAVLRIKCPAAQELSKVV